MKMAGIECMLKHHAIDGKDYFIQAEHKNKYSSSPKNTDPHWCKWYLDHIFNSSEPLQKRLLSRYAIWDQEP